MKRKHFSQLAIFSLIAFIASASSSLLNAAEREGYLALYKTKIINLSPLGTSLKDLHAEASENMNNSAAANESVKSPWLKWHKILGWSTLGMAVITMGSGAAFPHDGHCALAGLTSGLSIATGITGFFSGKDAASLKHGKVQNKIHAIMGALATIGFITSCAIYDEKSSKSHAAVGAASCVALALSLGVFSF